MPAIFISHSSLDPTEANDIKSSLARLGFERVFLDFDKATGIGAGENWEKRLYEELSRCHAVILVLTPNWMASKWCFAELTQARALGKVILPIICKPLGERFVLPDIQAVDLLDWSKGGLERLEQRLRAITNELARGFPLDPNRPPYPGIHAFEAEDAAIYFGRDDETREVIERLDARRTQGGARLLLVIGASGSGKSSLLKAGVLPQLSCRRAHWLLLPVIRPERAPLEAVAKAIAHQLGAPGAWADWHHTLGGVDSIDEVEKFLRNVRVGDGRAATVLLPIDQFEEAFTVASPDERAAFLRLLAGTLDPARNLPVMVIATGRSDVLEGLIEAGELARLSEAVPLAPMPLDRVPRLVEGPAAVAGLNVEKGLAERIAHDVESPEALPLLAQALALLHRSGSREKRLTIAEYVALGDAERALNPIQNSVRHAADRAITGLRPAPTDAEMVALRDAFVPHLVRVRLDDGKRVRQPARIKELPQDALRLIRALVEARLLTTRDGLVEVAHEALFKAWPTLDRWLIDEHDFLTDLERITDAHYIWAQAPPDQKTAALLHGLLLSRARDWLIKDPQRFIGGSIEPVRAFIAESAETNDARGARARKVRRRLFQATAAAAIVFAAVAAVAGWQYFDAENARVRAQRNFDIAKQAADHVVSRIAVDLRDVQGMRVESVRRILDAAQEMMEELARAAPDDVRLQHSRGIMFSAFAETYLAAGDLARARKAAEESVSIMRKLVHADPGNTVWQHQMYVSLINLGDAHEAAGDLAKALAQFEESLAILRKLTATDPGNVTWQRDMGAVLTRVGAIHLSEGDREAALEVYEESLAIRRKLAAADPGNARWQSDLSTSLNFVGEARLAAGDRAGALTAYEEGLAIMRKVAAADPGSTLWQHRLYVSLIGLGDAHVAAGDQAKALPVFEESLAILRKLTATDPGNATWQRDMGGVLIRIGIALQSAGDPAAALAAYEESLAIRRKIAAADPDNATWQVDLVKALWGVSSTSDPPRARAALREALVIAEALAREGKLTAAQQDWPQFFRDALAKLPPEEADAR